MDIREAEFMKYVEPYKMYGEKINLKLKHTFRVEKLCEEIAADLHLSDEKIEIAKKCGLLHDIGRFEQWKKYNSFEDHQTIDHGDLGYKILKKDDYLNQYVKEDKEKAIILKAVKYHNKYSIPKNLNREEKMFINITRDADKIDILYLFQMGILPILREDKPFSREVYEALINKRLISKATLNRKSDYDAVKLGFVFDINYSYSLKRMKKYVNAIIEKHQRQATNKELIQQLKEIQEVINDYIEERITC